MSVEWGNALRVADLARSLDFYTTRLGFSLARRLPASGRAEIDLGGYPLLLVGPGSDEAPPPAQPFVGPGGTIHTYAPDLDARLAELRARGVEANLIERWWGERRLLARDPDGYLVSFWTEFAPPLDRTLMLLEEGAARLDAALAGLAPDALDRPGGPGQWTIRQITHHVADTTLAAYLPLWLSLARPGAPSPSVAFDQNQTAATLDYAARPLEPSLALLQAAIGQLVALMRLLPDAAERYLVTATGERRTADRALAMLTSHFLEHLDEIEQLRRAQTIVPGRPV